MKTKNLIIYPNIVFALLIIISDILFMTASINPYIIKTISSALFVLQGAYNLTIALKFLKGKNSLKTILIFIGLVFAFIGDVLLIDHFVFGAIFFAIGHLFFLAYFILLQKLTWKDGVILAAFLTFALLLIFLYQGFDFDGAKLLVIVYAIVISLMLSKALGNLVSNQTVLNLILFVGAFLFYFSDLMLMFNLYTNISSVFDYLCLATYYPGECLLALSIALIPLSDKPIFKKHENEQKSL